MPWRMMNWCLLFGANALLLGVGLPAPAQDEAASQTAPSTAAEVTDPGEIAALIRDLDANRFSRRQDASKRLKELGAAAVPALLEAAQGGSREVSHRAFEVLKHHYLAGEEPVKDAAEAALRKLADSDLTPLARQAEQVLNPPPPEPVQQMVPFGPGQQIQVQLQFGGVQQVQMRNMNGVKDIDVKEQDRQIKIHEDPEKGITVEITQRKDDKEVAEKFQAKDVAELKEKHPEAHQLYEKYNQGGAIRIQAMQFPGLPMQQFGGGLLPPADPHPADTKPIAEQLEKISTQLDETRKLLEQLPAQPEPPESLRKALDQLRKAQEELRQARDKMK